MSQKPKAGARPRIAPVAKTVPLEPVAKVEPAGVQPIAEIVASPIETADEMIEATVEAVAEPVELVAESTPVVEEPIPAITVEAATAAPTITPTKPTPIKGLKTMMKTTEDFVAFGQANIEAFVKSGQIWSTGVQELTKQFATTAKASFDESVSTFKAISTVKSVKEAMELQSAFAKTAFEKAVAESKQMTDASIKLTEATLAPISARVTVAVETFSKAA